MTLSLRTCTEPLTARESELVAWLLGGITSNRGLAEAMVVSEHTVHFHLAAIFRKFDVVNRTQVGIYASTCGRVEGGRWQPSL